MLKFYITFGLGSPLAKYIMCMEASDMGKVWAAISKSLMGVCTVYTQREYDGLTTRSKYTLIKSSLNAADVDLR